MSNTSVYSIKNQNNKSFDITVNIKAHELDTNIDGYILSLRNCAKNIDEEFNGSSIGSILYDIAHILENEKP